ncbi:DMT family transporter [Natrinema salifodinae]|uniref:EamA-like transporter family protein n=1 Tax=Natrinema salifodinae TaxID=1202768 RepID=A0A1I0QY38_9EURY|nr:DMT family transporter [Natrinema salifodinae]SEW32462.1 EamA-like transporter family protein [Natrinema salifodinae]
MNQWTASLEERVDPMVGVAVAVIAISTSAILVRWSEAPSVVKAFYRVLFATSMVAPFALRDIDGIKTISVRDLGFAVVSGLALAAYFGSFFESLEWTSVAASVTLISTQPIFVGIGAAFLLNERLTSRMFVGMIVALVGAFTMSVGPLMVDPLLGGGNIVEVLAAAFAGSSAQLYGNAIAFGGALAGAIYTLTGRSLRQRLSLFVYTFIIYTVSTVALGGLAIGTGAQLLGYAPTEWVLFFAMALILDLFGQTVYNWALKYVKASVMSVSLLADPVAATILALVLLGEVPEVVMILGGVVVLVGIYLTNRARVT